MTRREFLDAALAAPMAFAAAQVGEPPPASRPNLLFILADDLGYGDLSCYGRPDYRTPALDKLAGEGMRFTSAYSAGAVCTPTRCAFLTGRYPQRLEVGLKEPLRPGDEAIGLPPEHPTIASLLSRAGYDTGLIGKWHLGWKPEFGPNHHGFREFFGILSGAADYFLHTASNSRDATTVSGTRPDLWENLTPIERRGYMTELLTDRAVAFIRRSRSTPFYLSLHYTAPHSPWEGPQDATARHDEHGPGPQVEGGSLAIYASMMTSLDSGIGRVLDALRSAGLERDTLVIFTSDNGGERYSFNWPFSFSKAYLWEGGIRVPAIVRWPGRVPAGRVTNQAAITMDWTATMLSVAGASADAAYPLDGEDLMPVCRGTRAPYERTLFWRTQLRDAARMGRWKYLKDSGVERLFDLEVDPGEKNDLRARQASVFAEITRRYQGWQSQMLPRT